MRKESRLRALKPPDVLLFLLFLLPIFFIGNEKGDRVEIWVDGKHMLDWSLKRDTIIEIKGRLGTSMIEIKDGKVRMVESPCPLKLCIHKGYIERKGEEIICIPQRIVIRIKGRNEYDAITY